MRVHFVHEFVEVVFVARAEVDEGLDGLVGVGGDVLFAAFVYDLDLLLVSTHRSIWEEYVPLSCHQ